MVKSSQIPRLHPPCSLGDTGAEARELVHCGNNAVVNIKTLKGLFIEHKVSTGWALGVVKSVEKKNSVSGQFADRASHYDKTETYCWTPKLNKEDCGVDKYF